MKHNELEKMIDKYVPMILTLSEMDSDTAEMKAGFIWIFLCDEIALPEIWKSDDRKAEII